jgi:glycosyltransferase involved in cell wall biosynthesis
LFGKEKALILETASPLYLPVSLRREPLHEGHMLAVLQVTPELEAGGVERTTIEMAQAITRAGGLALVASAGGRLERELETAGGVLIRMPLASKNPITMMSNALALARIGKERGVSLIHARSRAPAWSAYWAARHLGVPFVTTYHGIYNAKSGLKRAYNGVMAKGDMVIANSNFTREHVLREYHLPFERVTAIPRGVDLAAFDPSAVDPAKVAALKRAWGVEADDFTVILPARLTRWKGQLLLIEAAGFLAKSHPELKPRFVLAGDAQGREHYVEELKRGIVHMGLEGRVVIAGHVPDMPAAFAVSDAAVFPSLEPEAFGRGAIEAAAMGLPVIAAAHGGLAETIVDGETGLLFEPANPHALAAMLAKLIEMGQEERVRLGSAGQKRARTLYSTAALQASTLQVYDKVLSGALV